MSQHQSESGVQLDVTVVNGGVTYTDGSTSATNLAASTGRREVVMDLAALWLVDFDEAEYDTLLEPTSVILSAGATNCTVTEIMTDSADYLFELQRPWEVPPAHGPDYAGQ